MDLEGRLRDAMMAHEHEAPSGAEFVAERMVTRAPRSFTRWAPALAAAGVVIAVAIGVVVIRSGGNDGHRITAAPGTLDCPETYVSSTNASDVAGEWVPAKPRGFDGKSRLVPLQAPDRVVICAYLHGPGFGAQKPHGIARSGMVELGGELSRVAESLSWLPPLLQHQSSPCETYLSPSDGDAYLVGLSYPSGIVWVSAPGDHCAGASNGTFTTPANLRASAAAAYAAHRWTTDPSRTQSGDKDPCHVGTAGRLGQEKAMVPGRPVSATICKVPYANQSLASASTQVTNTEALVAKLNSLGTKPSTSSANCSGGKQSVIYEVLLRYTEGPPVFVRVSPGCQPSIDNLSLQADSPAAVALVTGLLAGR